MKINKRTLSCIATLVIIAIVISPSILQRAMILDNGNGDGDDDSFLLMTPLSESTFPNNSLDYIIDFNFIEGSNNTGNLAECLEALKYDDDNYLEVQGVSGVGGYYFNIEFLSKKIDVNIISFYDLFLYLKIESSIITETLYFQAFSNIEWINITEISNQEINIESKFLLNTTKFRIYHQTYIGSQKIISINRICFLYKHNKNNISNHNIENIEDTVLFHKESGSPSGYSYNTHWWEQESTNEHIHQHSKAVYQSDTESSSNIELRVEMDIGQEGFNFMENSKIEAVNSLRVKGRRGTAVDHNPYFVDGGSSRIELWNYSSESWVFTKQLGMPIAYGSCLSSFNVDFSSDVMNSNNMNDYFDLINGKWRFKFYASHYTHPVWVSVLNVYHDFCDADIEITNFTLDSYSYPIIENVESNPPSPISSLEDFKILTDAYTTLETRTITKVEYYIENYSSEWIELNYISNDQWSSPNIPIMHFENGIYKVWIRAYDDLDMTSLNYTIFELSNEKPKISFNTPYIEGEKIDQFYNYNINISLSDIEGNTYEPPEIIIYTNNILEPIIDWTIMEFNGYDSTVPPPAFLHYYNYSINPIDYPNNLYRIKIRTNDSRQIKSYNETTILIQNNPPQIEILQPAISELVTPMEWLIECNITNEDPINTAQWDIVSDLNANFTWKNLIYNGTTKYWEANFSILDYEYGNYFLVINATDDKYNSSLETKSFSFHPLIIYYFSENEISYNDNGITVFSNELITTDIIANIEITHHSIVKERDFEIYIPEKFEDANNYYISRGFDTYTPLGYFPDGTYTKWQILDYRVTDTVYFNLEKPRLINELIEEDDDDVITMEFILDSKHSFTNLHIENQLTKYITDPDNYIYTLYYLYAGDWEEVDDYDVEADVFPEFSFTWSYIGEDSVIRFKFKLEPIETEPSNLGGYIFFAFGILALVNVPFQIFGLATKKFRSRTEGEGWGMARYVGISIALAVGSFFGGFGIGYFIYG